MHVSVSNFGTARCSQPRTRMRTFAVLASTALVAALLIVAGAPKVVAAGSTCGANINPIVCENSQTIGVTPQAQWDIYGTGDDTIQGFATDISVEHGSTIQFKIDTNASSYKIDIYRLGWYGGNGARKVASISPSASLPQHQPTCTSDPSTGLYDCGNWGVSASWAVPSSAVSGVYIARLERSDTLGASHIPFVVRDSSSTSPLLFQTSDTTWQAYNTYGLGSFYTGTAGRSLKVSYNRPFATRAVAGGRDFLFGNEFPMILFLERNGYDVSYISGLDTDRLGSLLLKHSTFLSVGHDEYWSGPQRANVEVARAAGVNLAFFSGNEVYWKTRWEPSIDGSATSNRTLVCYKETWDGAKTDPSSEWTGTWRDPRFSPPSDGGRPENALTGTAYMSNFTDLAIQVSAAEGQQRLWRNTSAATLAPGQTQTLAAHTIGYESDEDLDNGFRPAGLIRMSTTTGPTPQYLRDFGLTVTPGTTTHHLTMYKASSGAKVFSAGTIQWSWGLDANHDGDGAAADPTMQQATVNLLADMGNQPQTLMSGFVAGTPSSDTTAPTAVITSPSSGAVLQNGAAVTVTGTASDVGGAVAGVEVSTDGGATWHPANGTTAWTYSYIQHGSGAVSIKVRATDDSLNTGPVATLDAATSCPCSIFGATQPTTPDAGDGSAVELGVNFKPTINGWVTGVRFYKSAANTGSHIGSLWTTAGTRLATGTFTGETSSGWQTLLFAAPVAVTAGTTYIVSYYTPTGHYAADQWYYSTADINSPPLAATRSTDASRNGVFALGAGFPNRSFNDTNYWVDAVFDDKDKVPPTVVSTTPLAGSSSVSASVAPAALFSEPVQPTSVRLTLTDSSGAAVPGSVSFDAPSNTATFTPTQSLARGVTYTASASATDIAGNAMQAPVTWTFRTALPSPTPGICPCSIWDDATTPAVASVNEAATLELGLRFTADGDGQVTGLRFYKGPQNTGVHTGSLWSASGALLATATFSNESTAGWQSVSFSTPVSIAAGTTYVVSYKTTTGYYAVTSGAFAGQGVDSPPLHAGSYAAVYQYGGGFPANNSSTNYWVDPVFTVPPSVVPTVTSTSPADQSTSVPVSAKVSATFSIPVQPGSASIAVSGPGGAVAGSTSYDGSTRRATFTPSSALSAATTYTVTVSGAKNLGGTPMAAPVTFTFTTSGAAACPCTVFASSATPRTTDSSDASAVSLGLKFVPDMDGNITGVRFYKSAANTGSHIGSLWTAAGVRLASVTFTGESASGWQTASFSQAVPVSAGTTYIVSYFAPNGHYSLDSGFFDAAWNNSPLSAPAGSSGNGLFVYGSDAFPTSSYGNANYWVDAVFRTGAPPDTTPPSLSSVSPLRNATSVSTSVSPSAVFSEPVQPGSVLFGLADGNGAAVAGSVSYDAASKTVTFTPAQALARGVTYTASVSASDLAGNAMTAPDTWSFRTALPSPTPGVCPCSVWDDAATPAVITVNDAATVELGMQFSADVDGQISGIRFYKGPQNTGTHTGSLWSATGTLLATATFSNESSTGWQSVSFATPVSVTAGTSYFVSYRAPNGFYSATAGAFATSGVDNPPLHVPPHAARYLYGGGFPTNTSDTNYWVTPVFVNGSAPLVADTVPPTVSALSASGSGGAATVSWTTDEPATSGVSYGTTPTGLTLSASVAGLATGHSVSLTGLTPNTRYYYRVTSADAAGNTTTSPASANPAATYIPTVVPITQSTVADFTGGTATSTYIAANGDGEVVLLPGAVSEFNGTAVPAGWTSAATVTGGKTTVAGGTATISGANLTSTTTYASGRMLEALVTLGQGQNVGWITTSNTAVRISLSVDASAQLVATVNDGFTINSTAVAMTGWTAVPHKIRIDWDTSAVTFWVDDVQRYTQSFNSFYSNLRPRFSDSAVGDADLVVDWVRVGRYAASGSYTSKVLDAQAPVTWGGFSWDASVPANTTLVIRVRTGNTATPDATWTAWNTIATSGGGIGGTARYAQFQLSFTSSGSRYGTPAVRSVRAEYSV